MKHLLLPLIGAGLLFIGWIESYTNQLHGLIILFTGMGLILFFWFLLRREINKELTITDTTKGNAK